MLHGRKYYKIKHQEQATINHKLENICEYERTEKKRLNKENSKLADALRNARGEIESLNAEANDLVVTVNNLKRDLVREQAKYDELDKLLCEAQRRYVCPDDCANKANYRGCRSCTRNPHAVDKYTTTDPFDGTGY